MRDYQALRDYLWYDPITGIFVWKKAPSTRIKVGTIAGARHTAGYIQIQFRGLLYFGHRVAWFFLTGSVPEEVDHRDGVRFWNAETNLRLASRSQQGANTGMFSHNTSGFKGVSYEKRRGKWEAHYTLNRRKKFVGYFDSPEAAAAARDAAFKGVFGEFARDIR